MGSLLARSRTYWLLSAAFLACARKIDMPVNIKAMASSAPQGIRLRIRLIALQREGIGRVRLGDACQLQARGVVEGPAGASAQGGPSSNSSTATVWTP